MPPHCDSLDGPVVRTARQALDEGNLDLVLPYVPADAEDEVRRAFARALPVRALGTEARETADLWFFETVVRLHRAGEGAPYTGLKPAGLSVGPVIPLAEEALGTGSVDDLADFLCRTLREELVHRLHEVEDLAVRRERSVEDARRHVEAALGLQVYSHHLYEAMRAADHHESDALVHAH